MLRVRMLLLLALAPTCNAVAGDESARPVLWYEQPAAQWVEALPIGNGRLGAMVFGGTGLERIQLNEDTLWAGGPYDPANPAARAALPEIRELLAAGHYQQAQDLADRSFMSVPLRQAPYLALGDLLITMSEPEAVTDYRRELDLDTAVARTSFTVGSTRYRREAFVSPVDQVLVIRLTAADPAPWRKSGALTLSLGLQSPLPAAVHSEGGDTLVMTGRNIAAPGIPAALRFETRLRLLVQGERGRVTASDAQLHVRGADEVLILLAAATSYRRYDDVGGDPEAATKKVLAAAAKRDFAALRADHVAAHRRLFRRVSLDLGNSEAGRLPTDVRVRNFGSGEDPALAALYFQYGRYLLISSSRPGSQPANLQGIWNDSTDPPWGSKYTININTEMNYWPAEPTALGETTEPLFGLIGDLAETGARFAREQYGTGGWVAHHNTDLWRAPGPIDGAFWGLWPTGGAWLCTQLWQHYEFTGDTAFLAARLPMARRVRQSSSWRTSSRIRRTARFRRARRSPPSTHITPVCRSRAARRWTTRSCATCSRRPRRPPVSSAATPISGPAFWRPGNGSRRIASAMPVSCRSGAKTGTRRRRSRSIGTSRSCMHSIRAPRSRRAARPNSPRQRA